MSDITLFPPTHILTNHSHQIYHHSPPPLPQSSSGPYFGGLETERIARLAPLIEPGLPCPMIRGGMSGTHTPSRQTTTVLRSPYVPPMRRHPVPARPARPPLDGSSPFMDLPDELLLECLGHLRLPDLLRLRRTCSRFSQLALHRSLHRSLCLTEVPLSPLPRLLTGHILPSVRDLRLQLLPLPTPSPLTSSFFGSSSRKQPTRRILDLLDAIPADQLVYLSFTHSTSFLSSTELGTLLTRIGGKLESLDISGSAIEGSDYLEWLETLGLRNRFGGLRDLNIGFTGITALPFLGASGSTGQSDLSAYPLAQDPVPPSTCWNALRTLSLSHCTFLSRTVLQTFLAALPANIESLDLTRLDRVSHEALMGLRVVVHPGDDADADAKAEPTRLTSIKLTGIDHLTKSDIRRAKCCWEAQRRVLVSDPATPPLPVSSEQQGARRRVWGEPATPEPLPIPPVSLPRRIPSIPAPINGGTASYSWTSLSAGPPSLSSSSSSGTSAASSAGPVSFSRASAMPEHAALWAALQRDSDEGMVASPGVWRSKLPSNPYLPSRSHPRPRPNPLSLESGGGAVTWTSPSPLPPRRRMSPPSLWEGTTDVEARIRINITHSAILESETIEGYRKFVWERTGSGADIAMPSADLGSGLGLGMGVSVLDVEQDMPGLGLGLGIGLFGGGLGGWGGDGGSIGGYADEGEAYLQESAFGP